ncbi:MAG: hypothetical protein IJM30_01600 [Thermoguttaceae bacterium]|nr:hypothetical protein [Thermoguttaceae bacterium]
MSRGSSPESAADVVPAPAKEIGTTDATSLETPESTPLVCEQERAELSLSKVGDLVPAVDSKPTVAVLSRAFDEERLEKEASPKASGRARGGKYVSIPSIPMDSFTRPNGATYTDRVIDAPTPVVPLVGTEFGEERLEKEASPKTSGRARGGKYVSIPSIPMDSFTRPNGATYTDRVIDAATPVVPLVGNEFGR